MTSAVDAAYDLAVSSTSDDELKRQPPDVATLLGLLCEAGIKYVVTGSAAAMLHGVPLVPGDLDITPATDVDNLTRLAAVLESIEARQDPRAPFGHWKREDDGEQHWMDDRAYAERRCEASRLEAGSCRSGVVQLSLQLKRRRTRCRSTGERQLRRADGASGSRRDRRDPCLGRVG